jgi:hypothetical protein
LFCATLSAPSCTSVQGAFALNALAIKDVLLSNAVVENHPTNDENKN